MKLLLLLIAGGIAVRIWLRMRRGRAAMPIEEARLLLDLPPGADRDAVQDAHRRLIARVHPDVGGSEELARRVNVARDALLAELNRGRPHAS